MLKHNDINIVGIDHGFGNLKTGNIVVPSGVKVYDLEPPLSSGLITENILLSAAITRHSMQTKQKMMTTIISHFTELQGSSLLQD